MVMAVLMPKTMLILFDGYWNAVSSEKFCDQTAIRIRKGAIKGILLSADLVNKWITAFPITCIYSGSVCFNTTETAQGENEIPTSHGFQRPGSHFCRCIKYHRPLEDNQHHVYSPVTDQNASKDLHIADSIVIGGKDGKEIHSKIVSEYDQEIPQSQTTD